MALIKNGQIADDPWVTLKYDMEASVEHQDIIISLERWQAEREQFIDRNSRLGLRLKSDQSPTLVANDLEYFDVIALEFSVFKDGRAFSYARLLRDRFGYRGELRAAGEVLRDQLLFMHRCGFNAYEVADESMLDNWYEALSEISISYQPATDDRSSVLELRHSKRRRRSNVVSDIAFKDEALRHTILLSEKRPHEAVLSPAMQARNLEQRYADASTDDFLRAMIEDEFPGKIAVVSSFGAEAAVLLYLVSKIDRSIPVVFLETGMHFPQTLSYRDRISNLLNLTDVRSVTPDPEDIAQHDPDGSLWQWDTDKCCHFRKVVPLDHALGNFDAWINGRKQIHGGSRVRLPRIEAGGSLVKVNALAHWTRKEIDAAFDESGLPSHPLVERDFLSVGCWPCTRQTKGPEPRSGRWADSDKDECGIHGPIVGNGARALA